MSIDEIIVLLEHKRDRAKQIVTHCRGETRARNQEVEAFEIAIHNLRRVGKAREAFSRVYVKYLPRSPYT